MGASHHLYSHKRRGCASSRWTSGSSRILGVTHLNTSHQSKSKAHTRSGDGPASRCTCLESTGSCSTACPSAKEKQVTFFRLFHSLRLLPTINFSLRNHCGQLCC